MKSSWLIEIEKLLTEIKDSEIKKEVISCIIQLLKNDYLLFDIDANERSISHKLAEYLQQRFPEWHVDCEYNRHGIDIIDIKRSNIKEGEERRVYPDIIVHIRNTNYNLLVIELKCRDSDGRDSDGRDGDDPDDIKKLKRFTDQSGKFKYRLGLFLRITKDGIEMKWFKNGRQLLEYKL